VGVAVARRYSEGGLLTVPQYELALRTFIQGVQPAASDAGGSGAMRLVGVSCAVPTEAVRDCSRAAVIFSAIVQQLNVPGWGIPGGRELLIFFVDRESVATERPIQETWTGIVQQPEAAIILQTGGMVFDLGRVFVLPSQ
jgi:hypothetical protein